MNRGFEGASSGDVLGVPAKVRRHEGRLLIIAFDRQKPSGLGVEGATLRIQRDEQAVEGVVLPVGSSNRIVMRLKADIAGWVSQDDILVTLVPSAVETSSEELLTGPHVKLIETLPAAELNFSIFTLVRNTFSYNRMLKSFEDYGFTAENTEFIAIDHRRSNMMNGYELSRFAQNNARGRYVILCHDDIELLQNSHDELTEQLGNLTDKDASWMIAGVAGAVFGAGSTTGPKKEASRISDRWGAGRRLRGPFPRRVESLDECFLVMPRSRMPQSTLRLEGYHFFGTDLCLQAELAGGSAYVIDFHFFHFGKARAGQEYWKQKEAFEKHYSKIWPERVIGTLINPLVFSSS